jgi:propionate CoA-transferase
MKNKVMTVSEALDLIKDGDSLAIAAVGPSGWPEYVVKSLEERYLERQSPRGLTKFSGCAQDDNRFAHPGFLKRFIASHPMGAVKLMEMAEKNEVEGYVLPQGVLQQLYRCTATKQPGLLTKIGMGTYIEQEGGKINSAAEEDIVRKMHIDGEDWLFYKSQPVTIAMGRGTTADEYGNVTMERENLKLELLEIAMAAKACNGKVIVQVERLAAAGSLNARDVVVPGELVDAVVVCEEPEKYHRYSFDGKYNPYFSGEVKAPKCMTELPGPELDADSIIIRRALFELFPHAVINLGAGIGGSLGPAASLEGIADKVSFTVELGAVGGVTQSKWNFPSAMNPTAFLSHTQMFDFYHAGGLDITFLGVAEADRDGNVNVSNFRGITVGQGGFIDISQTSRKVVFCTNFKAKGLKTSVADGKLVIEQEGAVTKLVDKVNQITFSGKRALENGQEVVFCTERAVFRLTEDGLTLTEIAPGVDLEKDILAQMGFTPQISPDLKTMEPRIFIPGRMGCFDDWQ